MIHLKTEDVNTIVKILIDKMELCKTSHGRNEFARLIAEVQALAEPVKPVNVKDVPEV